MKKTIILLGVLISTIINAQIGVRTQTPTETLDIDGNLRVRSLYDANGNADYPRIVVANDEGVLGYKAPKPATNGKAVLVSIGHVANGLVWNTKNSGVNRSNPSEGAQDNFDNYFIFGEQGDEPGSPGPNPGGWSNRNTIFSAEEGDLLKISSLISFKLFENFNNAPLNSISPRGDRQVTIILYLYKGNTMIRKIKKIVNFNGRDDGRTADGYDNFISQNLQFDYKVPAGGAGNDYSVSVLVKVNAPYDGNFRINFAGGLTQDLMVVKYK